MASKPDTDKKAPVHPVDEIMPIPRMTVYALQHVMSMYAGVVAVPLIIGNALGLTAVELTYLVSAGLFLSGIATIIQTVGFWKIGARQPIVQGTSFAAVSTMLAIGTAEGGLVGLRTIFGAIIVAGVIGFILAPVFTSFLRFFPEVVTGTIITVIGISLLPVGVNWAGGGVGAEDFGAPANLGLALATITIIVLIYRFLPPFFSRIAILLGLVLGTLVALPFGMTDLGRIADASIFQFTTPFYFGMPIFEIGGIISMTIVMLVIMTETTADILAIGKVVDKPADRATVTNGLRADMGSTVLAGVFNGFSVSAFAQNVGLVAITGIKSRFVVAVGGVILVLLGLFPILGAFVAVVPLPVLGGAAIALFGTVAASGIRTLAQVEFQGNNNLVIVALALGMGVLPIAVPAFYEEFPAWFQVIFDSGITAATITAVILNALFNVYGRDGDRESSIFSEAPSPASITDDDEARISERELRRSGGRGRDNEFISRRDRQANSIPPSSDDDSPTPPKES